MKKLLLIFLLFSSLAGFTQSVTSEQAKKIFNDRFISLDEARKVFPNLPKTLSIPYSRTQLEGDYVSWLVPLMIKGVPKYLLVQASYPLDNLVRDRKERVRTDTLRLSETKMALSLLKKLRPTFPNEAKFTSDSKYGFLSKDTDISKSGDKLKKSVILDACSENELLTVSLPASIENCLLNPQSVSYILRNKNGESTFCLDLLPNSQLKVKDLNIIILTLTYLKK